MSYTFNEHSNTIPNYIKHRPSPHDIPQMSHIISWDNNPLSYLPTITIPSSPHSSILSASTSPFSDPPMLPLTSASLADQQLCISTRQVFDYPDIASPLSPAPSSPEHYPPHLSITMKPTHKRPSSSAVDQSASKKPRAVGERISAKDFVPPDVSGLSKREARLVKNRAAAFLSRQRKREEFENMETRVAELEQENAQLLALTQNNRGTSPTDNNETLAENHQLRAQLAAAQERERELCNQLRKASLSSSPDTVKPEPMENELAISACPNTSALRQAQSLPNKASASFGLMVLLCALPSLLSMPGQSNCRTSFTLPSPSSSSSFDFSSLVISNNECTSPSSSLVGLDGSNPPQFSTISSQISTKRKLEFLDGALTGLDALDVSFETSHMDDGRIRVRIHPPSASPSSEPTSASSRTVIAPSPTYPGTFDTLASPIHGPVSPTSGLSHPILPHVVDGDPFLSANSVGNFGGPGPLSMSWFDDSPYSALDLSTLKPSSWASPYASPLSSSSPASSLSSYSSSPSSLDKALDEPRLSSKNRHVRIALKSVPTTNCEGGEWEVQIC